MPCYSLGRSLIFQGVRGLNLFHFNIDFYIAIGSIAFLLIVESLEEYTGLSSVLMKSTPRAVKWALLSVVILIIFVLGVWDEADFLYFQF